MTQPTLSPPRVRLRDHVQRVVTGGLAHLPPRLQVLLSGERAVVADGQRLDPHVQLVRAFRRRLNPFGLCEPTPEAARARFHHEVLTFRGTPTAVGAVRELEVDGGAGPVRARHYVPEVEGAPLPLTVFLHGGGFVIGNLDTVDEPCRILCRDGRTHVLSIDYRLAPEHPFPAGLDDALAALRWAQAHAESLGADPARVAVGGDSAGANLATVAARLATRAGTPPAAQVLIYPPTDSETRRPSHALFGDGYFLSNADRDQSTRHYLGGTGVSGADPRVSPLRAADLDRLPPALVVTAGFDLLRDEGEAYAAALAAAGTPARCIRVAGLGHGFIHMTGVNPEAHRAMVGIARDWRALLEPRAGG